MHSPDAGHHSCAWEKGDHVKRVLLYSPVPPMKTGTADYFELILAEIAASEIDRARVSIVIDESFLPHSLAGLAILGFPVLSHRQVPNLVGRGELRVYFLANNEFHAYCFESLSACSKQRGGRIVSVIHEPSCFMLMNNLSSNKRYTFDDGQMAAAMRHQFGDKAEFVINSRRSGLLPFEAEFMVSAQGLALSKSDEVWTHSEFARRKLELESGMAYPASIKASSHPVVSPPSASPGQPIEPKPEGVFRIGMFGWVAPSKRVCPAILAFANALQTQPRDVQDRFELMVVGQLPQRELYDPVGLAQVRDIADKVRFLGFVDPEQFDLLVGSCDLILNLRFPSCGETSGTLEHALGNGIPVITSDYQAFAELPASAQVSPFWPREAAQLFGLFSRILKGDVPRSLPPVRRVNTSIANLIHTAMCAE